MRFFKYMVVLVLLGACNGYFWSFFESPISFVMSFITGYMIGVVGMTIYVLRKGTNDV